MSTVVIRAHFRRCYNERFQFVPPARCRLSAERAISIKRTGAEIEHSHGNTYTFASPLKVPRAIDATVCYIHRA